MKEKYYRLYVPRAMWHAIQSASLKHHSKKPSQLAMDYLRSGLTADEKRKMIINTPAVVVKDKKTPKKQTIKKNKVLYYYNGEDFAIEDRPERIEHLKKFFYNMGTLVATTFDTCLVDPDNMPVGEKMEYVSDCAQLLADHKQEEYNK